MLAFSGPALAQAMQTKKCHFRGMKNARMQSEKFQEHPHSQKHHFRPLPQKQHFDKRIAPPRKRNPAPSFVSKAQVQLILRPQNR